MHDLGEMHEHEIEEAAREQAAEIRQQGEDIEGLEKFTLKSVGIDIGSSTSHLVFSRLTLRRQGAGYSAKFVVTDREVLFRSPISLTPYSTGVMIDTEKLQAFFHQAYDDAGMTPADVDTGAVVLTGEALKKDNAEAVLRLFAAEAGKFICASAGPNHETLLAAHGSGATHVSAATGKTVLNVDVGGGTSKLALIQGGVVTQTASLSVGARLVAFDEGGVLTRIEGPGEQMLNSLGIQPKLGQALTTEQRAAFAGLQADVLLQAISGNQGHTPLTADLFVTELLDTTAPFHGANHVMFSGGVSEYVYGADDQGYGDVGPLLGPAIRQRIEALGKPGFLLQPEEGIRATVIGAGEYTVQASGSTCFIGSPEALPVFGLKVVRPFTSGGDDFQTAVKRALNKFDLDRYGPGLAMAVAVEGKPNYQVCRRLAEDVATAVQDADADVPLYLVLDQDMAKSLGYILKDELDMTRPIIVVDGIDVGDLDYVDVGRTMGASEVVPVTVKSLLFPNRSGKYYDEG